MYLRPSRYAEADKFYGFAATEFGSFLESEALLEKVSVWVVEVMAIAVGDLPRDSIDQLVSIG